MLRHKINGNVLLTSLHLYVRVVYIEKERFYAVTTFTPREK